MLSMSFIENSALDLYLLRIVYIKIAALWAEMGAAYL